MVTGMSLTKTVQPSKFNTKKEYKLNIFKIKDQKAPHSLRTGN